MARTKNIIDETKLAHLKKMVENKFGRPIINSKDCNDLAAYLTTVQPNSNINAQTIRRLYGLVKTEHSPSAYTLDLLSQYVASCSWAGYEIKEEVNESLKLLADWIFDFFSVHEFGYTKVTDAIAESEQLQQLLLLRLASVKTAHWMFFEQRPLRDLLDKYYQHIIPVYMANKENTNEAKLFGYGLLFWGAFLTENEAGIEKYFKIIEETELTPEVYNIPAARKFGVPMMYYHLKQNENEFEKWFGMALKQRKDYIQQSNYDWEATNFDFVIAEHLLLVGRYEHCKKLWRIHQTDKKKYSTLIKRWLHHQQYILLMDAFCSKNFYKKVMQFDANKARMGERKFYSILFVIYQLMHVKKNAAHKAFKLQKQLDLLIADTGYTWFYHLVK